MDTSWTLPRRGTYTFASGDAYTGQWFAGKKHGHGRYRAAATGVQYDGVWVHGAVSGAKVGAPDGSAFYGQFKDGRPLGRGAHVLAGGATVIGEYAKPTGEGEEEDNEEEEEGAAPKPTAWVGEQARRRRARASRARISRRYHIM